MLKIHIVNIPQANLEIYRSAGKSNTPRADLQKHVRAEVCVCVCVYMWYVKI